MKYIDTLVIAGQLENVKAGHYRHRILVHKATTPPMFLLSQKEPIKMAFRFQQPGIGVTCTQAYIELLGSTPTHDCYVVDLPDNAVNVLFGFYQKPIFLELVG